MCAFKRIDDAYYISILGLSAIEIIINDGVRRFFRLIAFIE
jgi:hypothetical protein